jgi:hypothetical protein
MSSISDSPTHPMAYPVSLSYFPNEMPELNIFLKIVNKHG